jgi:hypothetical protein
MHLKRVPFWTCKKMHGEGKRPLAWVRDPFVCLMPAVCGVDRFPSSNPRSRCHLDPLPPVQKPYEALEESSVRKFPPDDAMPQINRYIFLKTQNLNGESSAFRLKWRTPEVTSCDVKVTSHDTKLLPATQSYFPWYKVISRDTKLLTLVCFFSAERSNFVQQEVTWEGSPCMTESYFLLCAFFSWEK